MTAPRSLRRRGSEERAGGGDLSISSVIESGTSGKDLGPKTAAIANAMKTFNPDSTWTRVEGGNG